MSVAQWGRELLRECEPIAAALDAAHGEGGAAGGAYRRALALAEARVADPSLTPSARMLDAVARDEAARFLHPLHPGAVDAPPARTPGTAPRRRGEERGTSGWSIESIAAQRVIEAADTVPFESYRQHYLAQPLLVI